MQIVKITKCEECGAATPGLQAWSDHQWAKHRKETELFHDALMSMTEPVPGKPGLRKMGKDFWK